MDDLNLASLAAHFSDPTAAAEFLEGVRWPNGAVCPHCSTERAPYRLNSKATKRRLWKCPACRKQFTVTVGTIFEGSHVPLNKWLLAFYLLCSSKKGMSAHQLHRSIGVTYKTAWFMFHRIRHAMADPDFQRAMTGVVEVDETYIGGKTKGGKRGRGAPNKTAVVTLVQRDGVSRSFRAANVTARELQGAVIRHVDRSARIMTDQFRSYQGLDESFVSHETVDHSRDEYARGEVHTNTVEGFFANLKRGITGTYHHVSEAQLPRYLDEFDYRYSTRHLSDGQRTVQALIQSEGKRLRYQQAQQTG
jgi:transposase-like protein